MLIVTILSVARNLLLISNLVLDLKMEKMPKDFVLSSVLHRILDLCGNLIDEITLLCMHIISLKLLILAPAGLKVSCSEQIIESVKREKDLRRFYEIDSKVL